jgi:hypothetical protein
LEVGLKDRLQDEFERPLHHPIPDSRNLKDADFAPVLRYLLPPGRQRFVGALNQFAPDLPEECLHALRLDGREGDPIYSGSTIIIFGQLIRLA